MNEKEKGTDEPQRCITHYVVDLVFFIFIFLFISTFLFSRFFSFYLSFSLQMCCDSYGKKKIRSFFPPSIINVNDNGRIMMIHLFSKYISPMSSKCVFLFRKCVKAFSCLSSIYDSSKKYSQNILPFRINE